MNNEDIIAQHGISVGCRSEHGLVCEMKAEIFKSQNLIDFFLVCVCVRVFLRRLYQLYSHPSPEQVPCCWLLLNIMRCAICCSVIETVLSAMLQSISVQTFHEASQCVLTSCQLISEAAIVFFWLSHVLHVVGLVYCIPGEKFGFKYLSVFSAPSGACMLQGPYF